VFSWIAITTGAFALVCCGNTTHAMTLSVAPTLIDTHWPRRGDAAIRAAALAPEGGIPST
jgi:hypothetical protein